MKTRQHQPVLGLTIILIASLACAIGSTPAQPGLATVVAETLQAVTQNANNPSAPSGVSASFKNISFVIPDGLATGASSEDIPAQDESEGGPWGVAPEHVEFTLTGYLTTDDYFKPVVHVYPAQDYASANSWAASSLSRLQAVLSSPSIALTNDVLPTIPFNGAAAQLYAGQPKLLSFNGGNGVRMISFYAQFPAPITATGNFYHYEGLTSDGKYFVAVLFPILVPLQATTDNPSADGVTYPSDLSDNNAVNQYYQSITDKLGAASPDAFQPSLTLLDALIQSITVTAP